MAVGLTNSSGGVSNTYELLMQITTESDAAQVELDLSTIDLSLYVGLQIWMSGAWKGNYANRTANMQFTVNNISDDIYANVFPSQGDNYDNTFSSPPSIAINSAPAALTDPGGFLMLDLLPCSNHTGVYYNSIAAETSSISVETTNKAQLTWGNILINNIAFASLQSLQFTMTNNGQILEGFHITLWGVKA